MEVNPPPTRPSGPPPTPRTLAVELATLGAFSAPLFLGAVAARGLPASWIEAYARSVYPHIGWVLAGIARVVPASPTELTLAALVVGAGRWLWAGAASSATSRRERAFRALRRAMLVAGILYGWFLNWGVLYHRTPVPQRWGLNLGGVNEAAVRRLAARAVAVANRDGPSSANTPPESLDAELARVAPLVANLIEARDGARPFIAAPARVPWVSPVIDALGIDGITSPFFREVLMNGALAPPHRACVLAHELAHVGGYAHEGPASLVGVLACWASPDPRDRYSAALFLLDDLAGVSLEDGRSARAHLVPSVQVDLDREAQRSRARHGALSRAMRATNDRYLRMAGDSRGAASYGDVVELVAAALGDE